MSSIRRRLTESEINPLILAATVNGLLEEAAVNGLLTEDAVNGLVVGNLGGVDDSAVALANLGFRSGSVSVGLNAIKTIDLGSEVLAASVVFNNEIDNNVDPAAITWSGNVIKITNSQHQATFAWSAWVKV